ncbi:hypothetical protein BGZ96_001681 [Linnemannia gamsii]|uniref:Protein kinase domain-containing protein n=1 Tax=Linnemannia gamsii TaxID=64522 RepID=A0ABQ7KBP8_9FUNG|nr:hypothetical protein BGZ96_001681 [Linnemannia gamsii]
MKFFSKQLVAGLAYTHKAGIRYCDLKPENVLVASGMQLKITDFGLAEALDPSISTRKAGRRGFWAPEVMGWEEHTDKIDIFPLGVIFYTMFTRYMPNFTTGDYLDVIGAPEDAKDFFASSLQFHVVDRIAMPELVFTSSSA